MNSPFQHLFLSLVAIAMLLSGCSHTYPITFASEKARGDTVTASTVNRRLANRSATIITRDGSELSISDILLTQDSCLFTGTTGRTYLPTSRVLAIKRVDHISSAVGGFGLGLLGGFTVGMGAAYLVADRSNADSRMGAGLLGISATVAGSLIGLGVGVVHGTVTVYAMPATVPDSSLSRTR